MFSSRSPQSSAPAALSAHDWAQRAQVAWREGAYDLAADCARQAVKLAPFSSEYRDLFTDILYDRIEAQRAHAGTREPMRESYREPERPGRREPLRAAAPEPSSFDDDFDIPLGEPAPKRPPQKLVQSLPASQAARSRSANAAPRPAPPIEEDYYEPEAEEEPSRLFGARRHAEPPGRPYGQRRRQQAKVLRLVAGGALGLFLLAGAAAMGNWIVNRSSETKADKVADSLPSSLRQRIEKASNNIEQGLSDRAVADLRGALKDFPTHQTAVTPVLTVALHADAERQLERKNAGAAVKALEEAIRFEPTNAELWTLLGAAHKAVGTGTTDATKKKAAFAAAETAYKKALELLEGHAPSMLGLGQIYAARNDRSKAIAQFEAVLKNAPNTPEAKTASTALASLKK